MPAVDVESVGPRSWADLTELRDRGLLVELLDDAGPPIRLALVPRGMTSGASAVLLRLDGDGRSVVTGCSLSALAEAVWTLLSADGANVVPPGLEAEGG